MPICYTVGKVYRSIAIAAFTNAFEKFFPVL
jgi:hypothetical protein